ATSVAFSPDGKRIASATSSKVKLWDVELGAELITLKGAGVFGSVAFSPDGKRLVVSGERTVCLYDAIVLNEDEKMARFHVDRFYKEMGSLDDVIAVIERADGWNPAMRDAALSYARSRAGARLVVNADAHKP